MTITSKLKMDLQKPGITPIIHAVQNDSHSRNVEISLYVGGLPFLFPGNGSVLIRYKKPDGKGGEYDTLPDGTSAWRFVGNILTVALAPQVLTVPGSTVLSVSLVEADALLSTFPIHIAVQPVAAATAEESENYFHVTGLLPAPATAKTGQYLRIASVNDGGKVTGLEAIDLTAGSGGYPSEEMDPTVPKWAKQPKKPVYTPEEVGADAAGTASAAVNAHNAKEDSHTDIRQLLQQLSQRKADTSQLPTAFYVTITGANGAYTGDKTTQQITEAYEAGHPIYCIFNGAENDSSTANLIMPLLLFQDGLAIWGAYIDGMSWVVAFADGFIEVQAKQMASFDDIPLALPNPYKLTFRGAVTGTYDGTSSLTVTIPEASESGGNDGYTPVRGVDYWTEADKEAIVQDVIAALGTPVFGTVDEHNNILLTGALSAGTYTLKYEDAEGNRILIGTFNSNPYTNWIQEVGITEKSRCNSSGAVVDLDNVNAPQATFVTGYIPVRPGDVIRLKNCFMLAAEVVTDDIYGAALYALRSGMYDSEKASIAVVSYGYMKDGTETDKISFTADSNGYVTEFTIVKADTAFIRLCLIPTGSPADAVVTVNQEID